MKRLVKKVISGINSLLPYEIQVSRKLLKEDRSGLNLNIGASDTKIRGFINLDLPSDWYDRKRAATFVKYDMRADSLPFDADSVDNIYCSHVIEHVEEISVERFIAEAYRVLKVGGVLRLVCPDADFLWQVSQFSNRYWDWLKAFYARNSILSDTNLLTPADCFTHVIATRRCRYFSTLTAKGGDKGALEPLTVDLGGDYVTQLDKLTDNLSFDPKFVHTHITWWDFEKLKAVAKKSGFSHVIRSKFQGSVSSAMRGSDMDRTHPEMSLYVECTK